LISEAGSKNLSAVLPSYWSKTNPVDLLETPILSAISRSFRFFADPEADGVLIIYTLQETPQPKELATRDHRSRQVVLEPIITAWIGGKEVQEGRRSSLKIISPPMRRLRMR